MSIVLSLQNEHVSCDCRIAIKQPFMFVTLRQCKRVKPQRKDKKLRTYKGIKFFGERAIPHKVQCWKDNSYHLLLSKYQLLAQSRASPTNGLKAPARYREPPFRSLWAFDFLILSGIVPLGRVGVACYQNCSAPSNQTTLTSTAK